MDAGESPGYVHPVARCLPLGLDADPPHPLRGGGQIVRDPHEFGVQRLVLHPFEDLVVAVQAPVEAVVSPAPEPFAELGVVFAPLPDGTEKAQNCLQILAGAVVRIGGLGPL